MSETQKLKEIRDMIEKAEAALKMAKTSLDELSGGVTTTSQKIADQASQPSASPSMDTEDGNRIVEGVFDGQSMVGADGKTYPVPANYASKSKLVSGDRLKLTIQPDGAFLYKQIGPVDRKRVIGRLAYEDGQYIVITDAKTYKVLLASVTYFKAEAGQNITLLVPQDGDGEWAAIENVITNPDAEAAIEEVKKQDEAFDISVV